MGIETLERGAFKKATRLELARAKNRQEKVYQNMLKTKERITAGISKLRELEAEYEAVKADVRRLKDSLQGTKLLHFLAAKMVAVRG